MSQFSEKCKQLLSENGYNVYRLSQTASLERTTLQRMVSGKRLPNIEFVQNFCHALRISPFEEAELIKLYKIESMGEAAYRNEEALIKLLKKLTELETNNYQEKIASIDFRSIELSSNVARQHYDAMLMLHLILDREFTLEESGIIYTNLPVTSNTLMPVLERCYQRFQKRISVTQLIYFQMNVSRANKNLDILTHVLPFFLSNIMNYQVLYNYSHLTKNEQIQQLFPYYVITSQDVLLFSGNTESAILLSDENILAQYRQEIQKVILFSRPLFQRSPSLVDAIKIFLSDQYPKGNEIYSLHFQPCFLTLMPSEDLYALAHEILPEQFFSFAELYIKESISIVYNSNPVIFSKEGLDEFCKTGKYYGSVGAFFPPFDISDRIRALKHYINNTDFELHVMLKDTAFSLPKNLFFELHDTQVLKVGRIENLKVIDFMIINESSICEAFYLFLKSLSSSSYIYTPEETKTYFSKKISELELSEKTLLPPPPEKNIHF